MATRTRLRTKLAWAWLALLFAAAVLGRGAGLGPLAWFETWFAVRTGRLLSADILFVLLILALPAIWILYPKVDRSKTTRPAPADLQRQFRKAATMVFALAGGFLLMAGIAGLQMARLPGGGGPSVQLQGSLAEAAAARRRIMVTGAPIDGARASFVQFAKQSSSRWVYTGFRPGAARGAPGGIPQDRGPIALFVERQENDVSSPYPYVPPAQDEVKGYLVENGLPDHARIVLEQAGVAIARPHYLLRVDANGLRGPYYVPLLLGLFFGFVLGLIGIFLLVRAGTEGRRAAADMSP